ncbi:MAG: DsbA family protein [Sphingomonadales bacterium]
MFDDIYNSPEKETSSPNKGQIEAIVKEYILNHPEIIPEAIDILKEREAKKKQDTLKLTIDLKRSQIERDGFSMVGGNPNGDITITEFYDYRCPFCSRSHPDILRLLANDKNLRIVYKQFPVKDRPGEPQTSLKASQMAISAYRQGKFEEFHNLALTEGTGLTDLKLRVIAKKVGLDKEKLKADLEDPEIIDQIRQNISLARELGISGTPTFVIGTDIIVGARDYDLLKDAISKARYELKNLKAN